MSSSTESTLFSTDGVRKRPRRMRVKKYNVDVSNSISSINMAGRIEHSQDLSSVSGSIDHSTINDIARIYLSSPGEAATSLGRYSTDSTTTEGHSAGQINNIQENPDIDDRSPSKDIRCRPNLSVSPPNLSVSPPTSVGNRIKIEEQEDEVSTQARLSLSSRTSSDSSCASGSSSSSSGYSMSNSDSSIEDEGAKKADNDNSNIIALRQPEQQYPESFILQETPSASSESSAGLIDTKYTYPESIYRHGTRAKIEAEKKKYRDDPSSYSSTISSKSTEDSSREQTTEPNEADRSKDWENNNSQDNPSSHGSNVSSKSIEESSREQITESKVVDRSVNGGHGNTHDNETTIDKGLQHELYEKCHGTAHQHIPDTIDESHQSKEGKYLEPNCNSIDKNDDENFIAKARKNLKSPTKSNFRNSKNPELDVNIVGDDRGRFQEAVSVNRQKNTIIRPKIDVLKKDDDNSVNAEQEDGSDPRELTTASTLHQSVSYNSPSPSLVDAEETQNGKKEPEDIYQSSEEVEMERSMDREKRFQLWLEHGVYVPPSGSDDEPESMSSSAASAKETVMKENGSSKKWWKRMGNLFHRREAKAIPKQDLSSSFLSEGAKSDPDVTAEEKSIADVNDLDGSMTGASTVIGKQKTIQEKESPVKLGISQVNPKSVEENDDQVNVNDWLNEPPLKISLAAAVASAKAAKRRKVREDHNKIHQTKNDISFTGGSLADQIAAAARSRKEKGFKAEDYATVYETQNEMKESNTSLADQVAAAAMAMKLKNHLAPTTEEDYEKLCIPKEEMKSPRSSLADHVAAAAIALKSKNQSAPMTEGDYDKLYDQRKAKDSMDTSLADQVALAAMAIKLKNQSAPMTEEDYDKLYDQRKAKDSMGKSLADQVASAAMTVKLKNQSAPMTEEDYDKLYDQNKARDSMGKSLADQVASAAMAVKLKNQSAPMTEEDYDKLYDPRKARDSIDKSLADQVASAAMAVKLKNKNTPMTEEDYDKLYEPKKERKELDVSWVARKKIQREEDYDYLKPVDEEKLLLTRKNLEDQTEINVSSEFEGSGTSSSSNHASDERGNELEENSKVANSSPASTHSTSIKTSASERKVGCQRFVCCFAIIIIIIIVAASAALVYSFMFADSKNGSDNSTLGLPNDPLPAPSKPTTSTLYTQSPSPSFPRPILGQPVSKPILDVTTATPISIPLTNSPIQTFTSSPTTAPISTSLTNSPIQTFTSSPTTAPISTSLTNSPTKDLTSSPTATPISISLTDSPTQAFTFSPTATLTSIPLTNSPTQMFTSSQTAAPTSRSLTSSPTQTFIDIDKPTILPTSMVPTNQPVIYEKPIPPKVTDSPSYTFTNDPLVEKSNFLRQFLIFQWPLLEKSLNTPSSPQSEAFEWLVEINSEFDSYSERQLIQRFVMATFFFSTNGENWSNNEGWLSAGNECQWYQAKSYRDHCDASGSLLNLELDGNSLSGSLPSELALLSNSLTRLNLAKNTRTDGSNEAYLSGTIPSEIGLLTMLQYISLNNQQMTGMLPNEIGKLSLLTVLDLERNKFEGSLMANIGDLQQLYNLYLGFNNLSGAIYSEIGRLQFLVNLDLRGNRFSSSLPTELSKLSYLQSLTLGDNKLTGTIPSFLGQLSNLRGSFDLSDNFLSGTIPTNLGQLSMLLTVLNLSSNNLSGPIPAELDRLVKLGNLQLQNNLLTGSIPSSFYKLSQLQILQLQYNNLTGDVTASVCDALVTNKIDNNFVPTSVLTDCSFKVDCECCQYCCAEGTGCECQFKNTNQDFLCRYGDDLTPEARIANIND